DGHVAGSPWWNADRIRDWRRPRHRRQKRAYWVVSLPRVGARLRSMCRAGGRRCDRKWADAHRERYNARRRIVRNSQKAEAARSAGDEAKAGYYEDLTGSAQDSAEYYDQMIHDHEQ